MAGKKTPELNSSSSADIAFLLLCYFLMTTTMNQDSGLQRRLPPMPDKNQKVEDQKVKRRNVIEVKINSADRILVGQEPIDISVLKAKIKEFLRNDADDPELPEKQMKEVGQENGKPIMYNVSKGVISLQNDRGTSYDKYIAVQNELVKAINELRDEYGMAEYGREYANLDKETQRIIRNAIPQNISEAEPKDVSKK